MNTTPAVEIGICGCTCGLPTPRTFRPGHDARMVSLAVKALVQNRDYLGLLGGIPTDEDLQVRLDQMANAIETRFSAALANKFASASHSAWAQAVRASEDKGAKVARKADRTAAEVWSNAPEVKVGRWTYPAVTNGTVTKRNTKRDGSGEWITV